MTLVFTLSEFGRTFATRERAADLRDELLRRQRGEHQVTVDIDEVANFSYAFADEFFGKLSSEHRLKVSLTNGSARLDAIADRAIARRNDCAVVG